MCPIEVELPRGERGPGEKINIFTYNDTIPIAPTPQIIARIARNPFTASQLANLRCSHTADEDVRRFILRNFGSYPGIIYWDRVLEGISHHNFSVDTKEQLIDTLKSLSQPATNFVFPIQLSSLEAPKFHVEYQHEHSYEVFGLVVGDSFQDQIFSWHKPYYSSHGQHHRLSHIWLPTVFAQDSEVMEALGDWLRSKTEQLHLFSLSLSEQELNEVGERLDATKGQPPFLRRDLYKSVSAYEAFPFPKYTRDRSYSFWNTVSPSLSPPKEADHYPAYSFDETFEVKSPALSEGLGEKGYWMAEVYIEADRSRHYNEQYSYGQGSPFWWQLPRRNYLAAHIFKGQARVTSRGIPAVQLPAKTPQLKFQLPDEGELLRRCVLGDIWGKMSEQVKRKSLELEEVYLSNTGRYLSGFLELFGGLAYAHAVLSERFWRNMFDVMSGRASSKDQNISNEVRNKLRKRIEGNRTAFEIRENYENLAEYVIDLSRKVSLEGRPVVFEDLLREARSEHDEFKRDHNVDWEFNENSVRDSLSRLLELGVVQMGFSQKCPRCGSVNWYLIDDVRQKLICDGCRYDFSVSAEPKISYRLNSLVRQGIIAHGLVPVVLVLGQMLRDARSSFFYSPTLKFMSNSAEIREGDLDIVCIKDGQLVIGEVKKKIKFEKKQALTLAKVAETIEADILLFSSLEKEQRNDSKEVISKVEEKLRDSGVQVGWYQLEENIFGPSRMDH